MSFVIRRARSADLPTITDIYNAAGVGTTASYDLDPVTVEDRAAWLAKHAAKDHPVLVLAADGVVVGYANYGTFRDKAGYAHTVEHSVYIRDGYRASGGGRMLMNALIDHARGHGVHAMLGFVDADNAHSIDFHRRLGFVEVARMPEVGRKFDRWLDVVIMQLTL